MAKMTKCKTCGGDIASNAKVCPKCGAKVKRPFYVKWWFWGIVIIVFIIVVGSQGDNDKTTPSGVDTQQQAVTTNEPVSTSEPISTNEPASTNSVAGNTSTKADVPTEYKSALKKAKLYSDTMYMSKAGIYDQLVSEYGENFTPEAAQYAIDNLEADWNFNALKKAENYQETMAMSPAAIHDQLVSEYGEKFTEEEADYAIANLK